MFVIGVDEAGYGPKLGPLVVAATLWRSVDGDGAIASFDQTDAFGFVNQPIEIAGKIARVDDSKRVFHARDSLGTLLRLISLAHHAIGRGEADLPARLRSWAPRDLTAIEKTPWLRSLLARATWPPSLDVDFFAASEMTVPLAIWRSADWQCCDVQARVVTAAQFNAACRNDDSSSKPRNKSDLLSETSLGLAAEMIDQHRLGDLRCGQLFFDRHGGRRYYAGVLSHVFPGTAIEVLRESAARSVYRVKTPSGSDWTFHFTVKGDSFAPVALASLHAKYLREVAMAAMNDFFRVAWESNPLTAGSVYRPTAGYPVDADRFLSDLAPLLIQLKLPAETLVRSR